MKRTTNAPERYERPSAARFVPCETTKDAIHCEWLDVDNFAQVELEHHQVFRLTLVDEHGYPVA